jgi:hypothetical protein
MLRGEKREIPDTAARGCLTWLKVIGLPKHQLGSPIPVVQFLLYVAAVILSFFVTVPVGVQLRRFNGACVLFSKLDHNGKDLWPWMDSSCDYEIYMNLAVNLVFASFMSVFYLIFIMPKFYFDATTARVRREFRVQRDSFIFYLNPIMTLIHCICWLLQVVSAVLLVVGFHGFFLQLVC